MAAPRLHDLVFACGQGVWEQTGRLWLSRDRLGREADGPTFTRADATTCATYVDRGGAIRTAAAGKLRVSWADTDSDGVFETPGLLLEGSRTNKALYSQDVTNWTVAGTPVVNASAVTLGTLVLARVEDNDAGVQEYHFRTYAGGALFTGDGAKAVSVYVYPPDAAPAGGARIQLDDTTAAADRLFGTVAWNAQVPSVAMSTGTYLGKARLGTVNGAPVWRLLFQTTSVTAANAHNVYVLPCSVITEVGDLYWGGFQAEDAVFPSSYIKTTTATVTRAADSLTFPIGFPPEDVTVYAKVVRPVHADVSGSLDATKFLFMIGGNGGIFARFGSSSRIIEAAGGGVGATVSQNIPAGTSIPVCIQYRNFSTGPSVRLDVGSGFGSWSTAGAAAVTTWATNTAILGYNFSYLATVELDGGLNQFLVARGHFTLAEMQAAPVLV